MLAKIKDLSDRKSRVKRDVAPLMQGRDGRQVELTAFQDSRPDGCEVRPVLLPVARVLKSP